MKIEKAPTRTVKRISVELNREKFARLTAFAEQYAIEKQIHLDHFQAGLNFAGSKDSRQYRNVLTTNKYADRRTLPARAINLAIKDGFETELKYWAAIAAEVRSQIHEREWTEGQKHYAYWLLLPKTPQRFSELIVGRAPINEKIMLTLAERRQVQNYLRRRARRLMGGRPKVRIVRSFAIDPGMYSLLVEQGRQYLWVTSLERGKRTIIPLEGLSAISGNLRIVLLPAERRVEVQVTFEVGNLQPATGDDAAIDVGLSEVAVDDQGNFYGKKFGETVTKHADRVKEKGRKRNKLHALEKKHRKNGNQKKARHLRRFNLGRKKLNEQKRRARIEQTNAINRAIAEFLRNRQPKEFAAEKLDIRGKANSAMMSRRTAMWMRSTLAERIDFKASAAGCRRKHINPAYTSQQCPRCDYVDSNNRKGDAFQCLKCGYAGHADQVAAINQKARLHDREITVSTPTWKVKEILQNRHHARVEGKLDGQNATVPGQTSGRRRPRRRRTKSETAAGKKPKPAARKPSCKI